MLPAGIGTTELLILGVVAILLFGSKLPEVARNLGKSYQQFRRGLTDLQSSFHAEVNGSGRTNSGQGKIAHYKDAVDEAVPAAPRFQVPGSTAAQEETAEKENKE